MHYQIMIQPRKITYTIHFNKKNKNAKKEVKKQNKTEKERCNGIPFRLNTATQSQKWYDDPRKLTYLSVFSGSSDSKPTGITQRALKRYL